MQTSILQEAACHESWMAFLQYKQENRHLSAADAQALQDFISRRAYLPLCGDCQKQLFPRSVPRRQTISKAGTSKKRIVYSYAGDEGLFLKFLAFQLFRYDRIFERSCYAFRRNYGVSDAISRIRRTPGLQNKFCLKVDISNYFNSIQVERLLFMLSFLREEDPDLYQIFERILKNDQVIDHGRIMEEKKGAMAGLPIAPFFANVYLNDVDRCFERLGIPYFRYSDDILLFADSLDELQTRKKLLCQMIAEHGLTLNPEKEAVSPPGERFDFLGFGCLGGEIDLSVHTIDKMKAKIVRKAKALRRWQRRTNVSGEKTAIGFIRAMNRKFFGKEGGTDEHEFTWSRWFFPNLTTDAGLRMIDSHMQEYIRYVVTGRHYKGNYRICYQKLKDWGYRSLVHEYYASKKGSEL